MEPKVYAKHWPLSLCWTRPGHAEKTFFNSHRRHHKQPGRKYSFVSEGDQGVDAHGAARGNVTGRKRNESQREGHASEGERIVRAHAVEHFGHQARQAERGN